MEGYRVTLQVGHEHEKPLPKYIARTYPTWRQCGIFATSKKWDARVTSAELIARSEGFCELRDRIVELAEPRVDHTVVDIGSGTGLLSLAFAKRTARVWAIDSSPAMNEYLRVKASSAELDNVNTVLASAVSLPLVDDIADLVVSNYCLHELRDSEKLRALAEARRVLKPGGQLVIGDMMFSLNPTHSRDRRVVAVKLRGLARRGLPGVWRLAKNVARVASGRWEHPANADWWNEALKRSGFSRVTVEMLRHEGGIAIAQAPSAIVGTSPAGSTVRCSELEPVVPDSVVSGSAFSV